MTAPVHFDLVRTVYSHGFHQVVPFSWDRLSSRLDVAVRPALCTPPLHTDQGRAGRSPVLISIVQKGAALDVRVDARDRRKPERLLSTVRAIVRHVLDMDRDLRDFHAVCRRHAALRWVPRARAGRILRCPDVFTDVVVSICGTNTSWKQAVRCVDRLCDIAPRAARTGPRCFPTAVELLDAGSAHLVDHARVGYRHKTILEFCEMVASGEVDLATPLSPEVTGPELRRFFGSLPGIGPITARYLATVHGCADELAVDSLVLRYIGDKYHEGRRPTAEQVQRRYASFGAHRALAYWFEFLGDVDPITWRGWRRSRGRCTDG